MDWIVPGLIGLFIGVALCTVIEWVTEALCG